MSASRIHVALPGAASRGYDVVVGEGLLASAGELVSEWLAPAAWGLISDSNVEPLYGAALASSLAGTADSLYGFTVPAGEASKSRHTVAELQDALVAAGLGRDGAVLALGGGVVGDLAGFAAATLYRGLPYVQVPTTLLAMVDSSVGGKTGIDIVAGKNLVGAFHHPAGVVADVAVLASLAEAEISAGLAEVIKYGVILDEQLFVDLEDGLLESCSAGVSGALINVVERAVRLKAAVVADDELEAGRRAILNFGHTVAHGVELASDMQVSHGQAVAIGMVAESRLACALLRAPAEIPARIEELCVRAGLPTRLPEGLSADEVVAAARHDKKVRRGAIRCALPLAIAEMAAADGAWTVEVSRAQLLESLASG